MGRFDSFTDYFSVGNTISQSSNTKPDDVLKTKNALVQTGYYKTPSFGITSSPDMGMINGLKGFQKDNGLKVDGVMKPKGPTESKIGETLANQGFKNVGLLKKTKVPPKPKTAKIDPLTGLPEVKMPKLKKATAKIWEQVAQNSSPKENPWFQSPKLKPVEDETHSANTRSMDGLLKSTVNGTLPNLYADSIKRDGSKAINEYANFMQQLKGRKEDRVDGFHTEVVNRLPNNLKQAFVELAAQDAQAETPEVENAGYELPERYKSFTPERIQKLQEAYEQDPEGFVQGNIQAQQTKTTQGQKVRDVIGDELPESIKGESNTSQEKSPRENGVTPCGKNAALIEAARKGRDGCERQIRLLERERKKDEKTLKRKEGDFHLELAKFGVSLARDVLTGGFSTILKAIVSAAGAGSNTRNVKNIYTEYNRIRIRLGHYDENIAPFEKRMREYINELAALTREKKRLGC